MELLDKGDLEIRFEGGVAKIIVGQEGKIQNITVVPAGYLVDKLEKAIPGDQTAWASILKSAIGAL